MTTIKSFAVGLGDMFYIRHNSDSFSVIDCCLPSGRLTQILDEVEEQAAGKGISRFISTHPDQDHISGLTDYDDRFEIVNFYAVKNATSKSEETEDFKRYKKLHDEKGFCLEKGCSRKWLNEGDETRGTAGIRILWPIVDDANFQDALKEAEGGGSPNNISPVIRYKLTDGASVMWMGDLETDFMEEIAGAITLEASDILFAPHHGRESGRVPNEWLEEIKPKIIVVGEAPSAELDYYEGWNTITQNSAGDIIFECLKGKTRVFVSDEYSVDFLDEEEGVADQNGCRYIGTLEV